MERRDFLKLGILAGATVSSSPLSAFASSSFTKFSLTDCKNLTNEELADKSGAVSDAWAYIQIQVAEIRNPEIKHKVTEIINNPAPKLLEAVSGRKKEVYSELKQNGWINVSYDKMFPENGSPSKSCQPFRTAPGSGYTSHHSYPGGLATHTGLNLKSSLALYSNYADTFGFDLDKDVIVAAQTLHDLHKPWVFQWQKDGSSRHENSLAGTGEHHVLGVAESIVRRIPPEICIAQACAHNHPGFSKDEADPVKWLKAASIIAGVDPVEYGLLASDEKTLPLERSMEAFVTHLGDHDWILAVPAAKWMIPAMEEIAMKDYGMQKSDLNTKKFYMFRNIVFSQATIMGLYHLMQKNGKEALRRQVNNIIVPA
jgi:hypothetical protein